MESLDLIEPFLSDLLGAEARTRPRRRRRLRAAALAAAAIAALAVPAWATGLLGHVFPLDSGAPYAHFTYQHGGRYVLARGSLPGRGSYRLLAFRADFPPGGPAHAIPFRAGPAICVMLEINRPVAPGARHGITTGFASCSGRADLARPAFWLAEGGLGPIGRGPRLRWGIVPSSVALVHVTLASGRHIDVRPNRFDPRAEHAAGFPFEFGYLAFAPPQGEKFRGLVAVDDHGRVVGRVGLSTQTPPGTPVRQSPAL